MSNPAVNITPIFVCGVGRSGTSLVQSMIGSHPEIVFPPETAFIRRYIATGLLNKIFRNGGLDAVNNRLSSDSRVSRLQMEINKVLLPFLNKEQEFTDIAFYNLLLYQYAESIGRKKVGDKDPRLVEYLPLINRHWPNAYIIHMIRDPRDVLVSKKKAEWSKGRHWIAHVFANRVQIRMGRKEGRRLFGERYKEVIYEELISDPNNVLKEICEWLGISFEQEMLRFSTTSKQLVQEFEMPWKKETLGPLLSGNSDKWKKGLSVFETALTEMSCREAMKLGVYTYSRRFWKLNFLRRYLAVMLSVIMTIAGVVYTQYRKATQ